MFSLVITFTTPIFDPAIMVRLFLFLNYYFAKFLFFLFLDYLCSSFLKSIPFGSLYCLTEFSVRYLCVPPNVPFQSLTTLLAFARHSTPCKSCMVMLFKCF